jgi:hypothetical protein
MAIDISMPTPLATQGAQIPAHYLAKGSLYRKVSVPIRGFGYERPTKSIDVKSTGCYHRMRLGKPWIRSFCSIAVTDVLQPKRFSWVSPLRV